MKTNKLKLLIPICGFGALASTIPLVACTKGNGEEEKDEPIVLEWNETDSSWQSNHTFEIGNEYIFVANIPEGFQKTNASFDARVEFISTNDFYLRFVENECEYKIDEGEYEKATVSGGDNNRIDLTNLPTNKQYVITLKVKLSDYLPPSPIKDTAVYVLRFNDQ